MSIAEKLVTVAENVPKVYEAGQKSEYDIFWDAFQKNGNRTDYTSAFSNIIANWTDLSYQPKYPLKPIIAGRMYQNCGVIETKVECDFSECTDFFWTFRGSYIKHIGVVDLSSCANIDGSFGFLNNCTDIDEIVCHENLKFSGPFAYSMKLQNVRFSGVIAQNGLNISNNTALTHDSIMSVVNCLKDYSADTSGTSWVVTLGATNLNKLTNAEKAIATEKGWTLV